MNRRRIWTASILGTLLATSAAPASWVFRPSYYSHDSQTGERVAQYAQPEPSYSRVGSEGYLQSGYRHNHTTLWAGLGGADNVHVVETWGEGDRIRPYGEWLFPYRAGATPYGPWGNPQGPWTLPFDSWSNPYGLMPRYYSTPGIQSGPQAMQPYGPSAMPYGQQFNGPYGQNQPSYGYGMPSRQPPHPNPPRIN
jgi:hypothetical protein